MNSPPEDWNDRDSWDRYFNAELLENRDQYNLKLHPVFRHIEPKTADKFIGFCREPEAWQRFLHDKKAKSIITGPD